MPDGFFLRKTAANGLVGVLQNPAFTSAARKRADGRVIVQLAGRKPFGLRAGFHSYDARDPFTKRFGGRFETWRFPPATILFCVSTKYQGG